MGLRININQSGIQRIRLNRRWYVAVLVLGMVSGFLGSNATEAADWMFRRSYYSHHVPADQEADYPRPYSRSAYRRAVVPPGVSIRGEYRRNTMILQNRNSTDYRIQRHNWFQFYTP